MAITITGAGVVSPFGDSPDAFADALLNGRTGIGPDAEFTAQRCRSSLSARVSGFDAAKWIPPMKLRRMDQTGPLALVVTQQALRQAKYEVSAEGDARTGVVLGTCSAGGQATTEYLAALFEGGPASAPALLFNSTVGNAAAGLAGLEFKLKGPNATISHKEASSLAALVTAVDLLRQGRADALIAGGVESIYDLFFRVHDRFEVMSDAAAPDASLAPFSATRRGFVIGEGGFALCLERGDAWRARGAVALGEIIGVGAASAAVPLNAWPDTPEPLVRTMRMALEDGNVSAEEVDVVYASANATTVLDAVEARALTTMFGGSRTTVTSIKGALGEHGATAAAACIAALLCGAKGRVPPIVGLVDADEMTSSLRLARSGEVAAPARIVVVNSFASGGALFSLVLRVGAET